VEDKAKGALRSGPAAKMMFALKNYYDLLTQDQLGTSDTPAAQQWRERRDIVLDAERQSAFDKLGSLQGALGGAQ
jgi:hypothetical protein